MGVIGLALAIWLWKLFEMWVGGKSTTHHEDSGDPPADEYLESAHSIARFLGGKVIADGHTYYFIRRGKVLLSARGSKQFYESLYWLMCQERERKDKRT